MSELMFNRSHALQAIRQAKSNGRDWLYENYPKPDGRPTKSRTGFLLHDGAAYPVKPLGRLANTLAGHPMIENPITNVFRAYFQSLGFTLSDGNVDEAEDAATEEEAEEADRRQRRQAEVWLRPRQAKFRRDVFALLGARCIVTGCETPMSLEAAHIVPVANQGNDKGWNGIPLRADIHRLFDAGEISIDPDTMRLTVGDSAVDDYGEYQDINLSSRLARSREAGKLSGALRERQRLMSQGSFTPR